MNKFLCVRTQKQFEHKNHPAGAPVTPVAAGGLLRPGNYQNRYRIQRSLTFLIILDPPSRPASLPASSFDLVLVVLREAVSVFLKHFK